jgi:hypothetical protein
MGDNDVAAWLDSPAAEPGGTLAVETRAALEAFDIVPGRFTAGESGVHRYTVAGEPGVTLQARVATDDFDPVVVVVAPSGARTDLSRLARKPDAGGKAGGTAGGMAGGTAAGKAGAPVGTNEDFILTEQGPHALVVSSRENVAVLRALTTGEYRLTLLCDAPQKVLGPPPSAAPSSRSGRFGSWESEPR